MSDSLLGGLLNRLQRDIQFRIAADDAAAVANVDLQVTLQHTPGERPTIFRTEPEPQQMTSSFDFRPILKTCTCVQNLMVVKELNVAWFEGHIQLKIALLIMLFII